MIDKERRFYDHYAKSARVDRVDPREAFPACSGDYRSVLEAVGEVAGKRILDIGCGHGDSTVFFGLQGAMVIGIDVSNQCLKSSRQLASRWSVAERIHLVEMNGCRLGFADESFDVIYSDGVLHHMDLIPVLAEVKRVLKEGGVAIFIEPQQGNIFMQIYRLFASDLRSEDERPLRREDLALIGKKLGRVHFQYFHLLSLCIFGLYFLILRLRRKTWPYWFDDVTHGKFLPKAFRFLQKLDDFLLRHFLFLRSYTWNVVIYYNKGDIDNKNVEESR